MFNSIAKTEERQLSTIEQKAKIFLQKQTTYDNAYLDLCKDSINYLILLEAVFQEKLEKRKPKFETVIGIGETLLSPENVKKMREFARKLHKSANIVSDTKKPTAAFICEKATRISLAGKPVSVFCRRRKGPCKVYEQWAKEYNITEFEYSTSVDTVIKVNTCTKSYTQIDVAKND